MRALTLAVAFIAALLSPQIWPPAWAASSSSISIACGTADAGSDVGCTITRTSALKGIYILVRTSDGSAIAGTDYTALGELVYLRAGQTSASVAIHTAVDANATGTLSFKVAIIASATDIGNAIAEITEPAPPAPAWVSAPLQDGGFAQVINANDDVWSMTGPGPGRPLVNGEIVVVYFNGGGYQANGQPSYAIYALSDGTNGRALASDLKGVTPVGITPALPANWWVPGKVTANKTCADARNSANPGVVQGGAYRAAMVAGSHTQLAAGQTGLAVIQWQVFATDNLNQPDMIKSYVVVTGDCLTGAA